MGGAAFPVSRFPFPAGGRVLAFAALALGGCGPSGSGSDAGPVDGGHVVGGPFAVEVVRFTPGDLAGHGQDGLPGVVLGPPHGGGRNQGNTDSVLSLGLGGVIELRLGEDVVDGEGPDLLVFENAFEDPWGGVHAEPAEIAVSLDGESWHAFPCAADTPAPNGCAGYAPVFANGESFANGGISPTDPEEAGGDRFDLAELGLERVRFVRITDRNTPGGLQGAPTAGFDLDAIAVVNAGE